jgi:hypothetical protein
VVKLDENIVHDLPVHDSDVMEITIFRNKENGMDMALHIAFCEGEYEELSDYSSSITPDGLTFLIFKNCKSVKMNANYGSIQGDLIDYIELCKSDKDRNYYQGEIIFISGSKLECLAESVFISSNK